MPLGYLETMENKALIAQSKILFVDDDKDVCRLIEDTLSLVCKDIICVNNGEQAIEVFLEHGDFDILLTDIVMPQMDGMRLINEIRKYDFNFPIIITSAHSEVEYVYEAINLGVSGYVYKPIELDSLIKRIERVVEARILRKKLEQFNYDLISKLKERSYELNTILNSQDNMIAVANTHKIHTANSKFLNFFGFDEFNTSNNYVLLLFEAFIKDNDYFFFNNPHKIGSCFRELEEHSNEIYVKMQDTFKKPHIFKLQVTTYDYHGTHYVLSFTDITAIKTKADNYRHKASHDSLTSLYNRLYFNEILNNEISRALRYKKDFVLVMFDIDHFKHVNDTYGHDVGDEVLIKISILIKQFLRNTDIFARWGGEEFMIFMPESNMENAFNKIETLREKIQNTKLSSKIEESVTVSFGITEFEASDTKSSLLKRVDIALYNAKKNGRNRIEFLNKQAGA
jgi:two-component system, cell cycle response regulator